MRRWPPVKCKLHMQKNRNRCICIMAHATILRKTHLPGHVPYRQGTCCRVAVREDDGADYVFSFGGRTDLALLALVPPHRNVHVRFVDSDTLSSDTCTFRRIMLEMGALQLSTCGELSPKPEFGFRYTGDWSMENH